MGNKTTTQLSIIMPVYNKKELVKDMIDSIVANDFDDYELIVIDDGSTTETLDFLKEKESRIRQMKVISRREQPKGPQTCRNLGLEIAVGKYVVFFDSDDFVAQTCLRTRVEQMESHPDTDFMVFPSAIYVDGKFIPNAPQFIYGHSVNKDDLSAFARREIPFTVWTNIYKRSSLKTSGIKWDTEVSSLQDSDFNLQAFMKGLKYEYANVKADYGYRIFTGSTSVSKQINTYKHFDSHLYTTAKFFEQLQAKYGHRYDWDIFQGVLFLYNTIFSDGMNKDYALRMVKCVQKYNKNCALTLRLQVAITAWLAKFLPAKRARQIPMAPYLVLHILRMKLKRRRMNPIL